MKAFSAWRARSHGAEWWLIASILLLASALPNTAFAGGLYLMPRGVETAARAGASVAGVRSPHALWYNPAGLVASKRQVLVDFSLPFVQTEFTRTLDDGTVAPTVNGNSLPVPIPSLGYSDNFGFERLGFGIGLIIPSAYASSWPSQLPNGGSAPQRYSILDANNSFIGSLAIGAAFQATSRLSVGAALYLTAAQVGGTVAVSACEYVICTHPEGKEWEGRTRFLLGPVYTATAVFGATYDLDFVRLGASVQLRTKIGGEAQFDLALPDQAIFDDVELRGPNGTRDLRADMSVVLPAIVRLGAEFQPLKDLRVELAGTWEHWAAQKSIRVNPKGIVATNVPSVGDVRAQAVSLARNMRDTWAVHLGGTYDLKQLFSGRRNAALHAGAMYETSAVADQDLNPALIDTQKLLVSVGASLEVARGIFLDATYGHLFMQNRNVRNSQVLLPAAIKPLPQDDDPSQYEVGDRPAIGNGKYVMEANYVGLGLRFKLDDRNPAAAAKSAPVEEAPAPKASPESASIKVVADPEPTPQLEPGAGEPMTAPVSELPAAAAEAAPSPEVEPASEAQAPGGAAAASPEPAPAAPGVPSAPEAPAAAPAAPAPAAPPAPTEQPTPAPAPTTP